MSRSSDGRGRRRPDPGRHRSRHRRAQLLLRHYPAELDAVIVSHMHADHMLDLVTLRYVYPWRRLAADIDDVICQYAAMPILAGQFVDHRA